MGGITQRLLQAVCTVLIFTFDSGISLASGFKVDMTAVEAAKYFDNLRIDSLAIGETGLVSIYALGECVRDGELRISSLTELQSEPSKYSYAYEVTREPGGAVTIALSKKGKLPDVDAIRQAVFGILASVDCDSLDKKGIPLLEVRTFLGASSLSELVAKLGIEKMDGSFRSGNQGTGSTNADDWMMLESKSPIDDSPSITLLKSAEQGNQALVIRCRENKTDAYILTENYLSDESENVLLRYDESKAESHKLSLSTDKKALFFNPAISNIKAIMAAKRIIVRYRIYNGTQITTSFKVSGLSGKILPLRQACNW